MRFQFDDGGRAKAGYRGKTGDCVCRAIAIAAEMPYQAIYDLLNERSGQERITKRRVKRGSARTGVHKDTTRRVLESLGWKWTPTMQIGSGCKVHLREGELPKGRLIVSVSRHMVAVIDGVIRDTHDCSRRGNRCVYGYWQGLEIIREKNQPRASGSPDIDRRPELSDKTVERKAVTPFSARCGGDDPLAIILDCAKRAGVVCG